MGASGGLVLRGLALTWPNFESNTPVTTNENTMCLRQLSCMMINKYYPNSFTNHGWSRWIELSNISIPAKRD